MRKSLQILGRDAMRLVRQRRVWVIVIGVLITPALYAWFNINAFWDPYSNTSSVRVAVVNLDEGADSDLTGPLDVGEEVVAQLKENDELGWVFMDEGEAQDAVKRGDVYATIVIPTDFSTNLISITTDEFTQPALQYYVNEKASAIAPKITDVGASQLDAQITSSFTEQVAEAVSDALKEAGDDTEGRLEGAKTDSLNAFDEAMQTIDSAREELTGQAASLDDSRGSLASASSTLSDVDTTLGDVQVAIEQAKSLIAEAQDQVIAFTDAATSAYVDGTTQLADAAAAANLVVTDLSEVADKVGLRVDGAIEQIRAVVEANATAIARLQELVDGAGLDEGATQRLTEVIDTLQQRNETDQQLLADLQNLNDSASGMADAIQASADSVTQAVNEAQGAATDLRSALTSTVPALNSAMSSLSTSAGEFSAAIDGQRDQLVQAQQLLSELDTQLVSTSEALTALDGNLAGIQDELQLARTDISALSAASEWSALSTITGLDSAQIAKFVASPVEVSTHVVFPISTYGSAMAALFTNLSLWIGAFVLMVIFRTEVDTEGLEGLTVRQAYFGRFFLFAILAVVQALIVCIGNLVIGIQVVSAAAFVGTGVLVALAYVSIVYALCVAFGHVGRGLCILFVIMQIPGASGLYPIEMMPGFFRAIYPFLPFTYGIDAMRETIAGFYGSDYWQFLGVLAVFVLGSFVVGLVVRRRFASLNAVFNREVVATDLLVGEKVQIVGGGYRLPDLIHALANREEYRDELSRRAEPFTRRYPALLRTTVIAGLGGLVVIGIIAWLVPGGKASLLGVWLLWSLLVIGVLVTLEYFKQSFARAGEVASLGDDELRRAVVSEGSRTRVAAGADGSVIPEMATDGGDRA
ncbi:MAG: YhgE/Pip family protein [Candidatus Microbacterium stercoravium]